MHHRIHLLALPLLALLAACDAGTLGSSASAPADSAAGEVSFRLVGPGAGAAIVVPVQVNGSGPYDLILDTGATLTCLDSTLVRELELPPRRAQVGAAVGVGGAGRVELVKVDSLRVGRAVVSDVTACSLDLRALRAVGTEVRGLLGLNALREFRVVLDFERNVLSLTQPGAGS